MTRYDDENDPKLPSSRMAVPTPSLLTMACATCSSFDHGTTLVVYGESGNEQDEHHDGARQEEIGHECVAFEQGIERGEREEGRKPRIQHDEQLDDDSEQHTRNRNCNNCD